LKAGKNKIDIKELKKNQKEDEIEIKNKKKK